MAWRAPGQSHTCVDHDAVCPFGSRHGMKHADAKNTGGSPLVAVSAQEDTQVTMKALLEAGVHFGHQTKRWNPKMRPYIFGERNGIYIIDLGKTARLFRDAEQFVMQLASEGRTLLFVGTKRQAQDAIAEEAARCGMFHVNQRWLGGLLTNFTTIQRSLARLRDLEAMETDGRYEMLSKKEIARLEKEKRKLQKNLDGIRHMERLPDAVFIVDTKHEQIAVDEARKLKI